MILIYTRVSTTRQADDESTSLPEQVRKCKAVGLLYDADPMNVAIYEDAGVSGSLPIGERPSGKRLMDDAKDGDVIIALKLDRAFRSASDALNTIEALHKRKVKVILVDMDTKPLGSNGIGKVVLTMLSAFAEFERERITERMEDGRKAKRAKGGCIGAVPYGWRKVGTGRESLLEAIPEEQVVIAKVKSTWDAENPYATVKMLNRAGVVTRSGEKFHVNQVRRIAEYEMRV